MWCLALHAMQEYGVTMQVEEDKARIANPHGWPVSKDNLRSLKKDTELRIFQISEKQQRLGLKDRWKSHYNEFTGRSVDEDETDLLYQYLDDDRFIVDGDDVYLNVPAKKKKKREGNATKGETPNHKQKRHDHGPRENKV